MSMQQLALRFVLAVTPYRGGDRGIRRSSAHVDEAVESAAAGELSAAEVAAIRTFPVE